MKKSLSTIKTTMPSSSEASSQLSLSAAPMKSPKPGMPLRRLLHIRRRTRVSRPENFSTPHRNVKLRRSPRPDCFCKGRNRSRSDSWGGYGYNLHSFSPSSIRDRVGEVVATGFEMVSVARAL
ncbi:hypothetical protein VNO77_08568 [Canavalia gladiata]|uniref:Uncharacterized protein n=1 Tax=Canavalia gladiata TaxID=3824 RepID=A0AAN9ME37_CANGL